MHDVCSTLEKIEKDSKIVYMALSHDNELVGLIRASEHEVLIFAESLSNKACQAAMEHFCVDPDESDSFIESFSFDSDKGEHSLGFSILSGADNVILPMTLTVSALY